MQNLINIFRWPIYAASLCLIFVALISACDDRLQPSAHGASQDSGSMSATQVLALTQDPEPVLTVVPTLSKTPLRPTPKATPLTVAPTLAPTEAPKAPAPTPTPTLATPPAVAPRSAPTTDLSRTEVPKPAAPTPVPTVAPPPASTAGPATQAAALPNAVVTTAPSSAPAPTPMPQWGERCSCIGIHGCAVSN